MTLLAAAAGTLYPYLLPEFPPGTVAISIFDGGTLAGRVELCANRYDRRCRCGRDLRSHRLAAHGRKGSRRMKRAVSNEYVARALAGYDRSRLTLCSIGSHSALEVAYGARAQGLRNLVVTAKGRERTYASVISPYARRRYLEAASMPSWSSTRFRRFCGKTFSADSSTRTSSSCQTVPSKSTCGRSTITTRSKAACSCRFSETAGSCEPKNATLATDQYALLKGAGIRHPAAIRVA